MMSKKQTHLWGIAALALTLGNTAFAQTGTMRSGKMTGKMSNMGGKIGHSETSTADKKFAMEAAQGGVGEVKLGELASRRGASPSVKAFGQHMVNDHSKANVKLEAIASKKGMTLPTEMPDEDKPLAAKLAKLSGAAFDSAYRKAMIEDHVKDIAEFSKEARTGRDPEIRAFAAKTLPTLKQHLSMAKAMGRSKTSMMHKMQ